MVRLLAVRYRRRPVFNRLFFPVADPALGTLAALATFAVGFAARPRGGALFGHFGDTRGRASMLVLTLLMGAATTSIGLLPTYDQIGFMAPVLLVALRLCQGIGLSGQSLDRLARRNRCLAA